MEYPPPVSKDASAVPARRGRRRVAAGKAGEDAAAAYLERAGLRLIERNWRCRQGEIDLIAMDGREIVVVEVRSRTNPLKFGTAVEAITPRKCRQVREVAAVYLHLNKLAESPIRFDVVAVTFRDNGEMEEIKHISGAF